MKKIMFLVHLGHIKKSSGIIEKILNQSKNMATNNIHYKTYIFCRKEDYEDTKLFKSVNDVSFIPLDYYKDQPNLFKKLIMVERIYKEYIKICEKEKNNYDYIYIRYNPLFFGFINFANKFKKKLIFEHNSIELSEYKSNKNNFYLVMEKIFGKFVRSCAKYYVTVSNQIYMYQKELYKEIPGINIPNGIDTSDFKSRKTPSYDGKNLNLLFVGNIRYWHGIERIISSIKNYKGNVNITLNICGDINQEDYLTPLINDNKTNYKINMLGYKTKKELDKYFNEAHIAIGCLGCYKKNIDYASTLKNREYFSRGIPIIFSEYDDDICVKENKNLYLKVLNDDSEIDMDEIINFVEKFYQNKEENTKKIINFAKNNLDYFEKIKTLKELITEDNE